MPPGCRDMFGYDAAAVLAAGVDVLLEELPFEDDFDPDEESEDDVDPDEESEDDFDEDSDEPDSDELAPTEEAFPDLLSVR